ncbi:MAG: TetR/AcrR family transcriptional regulator [Acidimicrobiales bacterium]
MATTATAGDGPKVARGEVASPDGVRDAPGDARTTDGRKLRRRRNRDAVVEALLDLYQDGELVPSTDAIASRSGLSPRSLFRYFDDVNDLIRAAVERQLERALPHTPIAAGPDDTLEARIRAVAAQRFDLFAVVGNAATVVRLRAPFQPLLAVELARNRHFLCNQLSELFAPELEAMGASAADSTLALADVLTSFETCRLLIDTHGMSPAQAESVLADGLSALFGRNQRVAPLRSGRQGGRRPADGRRQPATTGPIAG